VLLGMGHPVPDTGRGSAGRLLPHGHALASARRTTGRFGATHTKQLWEEGDCLVISSADLGGLLCLVNYEANTQILSFAIADM
jgi:hypothetical protein